MEMGMKMKTRTEREEQCAHLYFQASGGRRRLDDGEDEGALMVVQSERAERGDGLFGPVSSVLIICAMLL